MMWPEVSFQVGSALKAEVGQAEVGNMLHVRVQADISGCVLYHPSTGGSYFLF